MKIKNFKVNIRLKEVYNLLKNKDIKITPEIETMVTIVEREVNEILTPAVVFETFETQDEKLEFFTKYLSIPKNAKYISFVATTLGENITKFISSITDTVKKTVAEILLQEYLNSSVTFIVKLIQERLNEELEAGSIFLLPEDLYEEVLKILSAEKINISYDKDNKKLSPDYTCLNYVYWFKMKK